MIIDAFFNRDLRDDLGTGELLGYRRGHRTVIYTLALGLVVFVIWANLFSIEQVSRASGEVIASSRVQIIQAIDGGVIESLAVREGDRVARGQILARLEQTRIGAAVEEVNVRLAALKAKTFRLKAEVIEAPLLEFPRELDKFPDILEVEQALFKQRREGLRDELQNMREARKLVAEELRLVQALSDSRDANRGEVIRAERTLNEAQAKIINRRNNYFETARTELAEAEDAIAQNEQILKQRQQQFEDSVFVAQVDGVVKNIRVTTIGGVLRAGEELMQIVPVDDALLVEAKAPPSDIAQLRKGLAATIRFDPYDYTIYGGVEATVTYVSVDTLKEESRQGEEIYYRVHVSPDKFPVFTSIGREIEMMPGMTAQVDIRTGERSLLDYLLKPVRKTLSESFGER